MRWKVPAEVGGADIKIEEYVVEARASDGAALQSAIKKSSDGFYVIYEGKEATKRRISQLRPGADYQFRVKVNPM